MMLGLRPASKVARGAAGVLPALLATGALFAAAPSAAEAFSLSRWEAGTCSNSACADAGAPAGFYTQAAGHPDFGITDFEFNVKKTLTAEEPIGNVKDVRVDLPVGLAVNPEATPDCSEAQLGAFSCPAASQVGVDQATGTAELVLGIKSTVKEEFPVYNMERKTGQPARFAVEINSKTLELAEGATGHHLRTHLFLEGGLSWHQEGETSESSGVTSGDFHEFFKIQNIATEPEVIESRLIFWGVPQQHTGLGAATAFITLPSTCSSKPITYLHVDSYEAPGQFLKAANETPVAATGCAQLQFNPSLSLSPATSQSDQPDGFQADLHIPQFLSEPARPDSPDLQHTEVSLPEGMTLNPSAAHGLEACSDEQIAIGSSSEVKCPGGSEIGTVTINAPGIPNGSLSGHVYLASPRAGKDAESGEKYRVFLAAEAAQYGVGLRLEGQVRANTQTGRLTASFGGTPQVPFEDFKLQFRTGPRAPLANPLVCGPVSPQANLTPYTGQPSSAAATQGFTVDANNSGGRCPSPLPFSLVQQIPAPNPATAGAYSPFNFNLTRGDGQQYLSQVTTTLPPGLLGAIPSVPLCGEPQASTGTCPATSQIGTVTVAAGAGTEPYSFKGQAFLTGPYGGSPYGLSIVVPAVAGPYDLGSVVARAAVNVGLYSARVIATASVPTIKEGVPLRLKSINVDVNRPKFIFNPTNCTPLAVDSTLGSTFGATQNLSSPFQVSGCTGLPFKPVLAASTGAKTSKANGASITVKVTQTPGQANVHEVILQLPKQLPARLTTLQKACPAATFELGPAPGACPSTSMVGSVAVITPVLPTALIGPAYLVSHGGEAFPDLDLILRGSGVTVVLVGHTNVSRTGVTTSKFESLPDVPFSSATVSLPVGPRSVLGATSPLCAANLAAPTTILAQSGVKVTPKTRITVSGCGITVLSHRIKGMRAILKLLVPVAGRVSVSGHDIRGARRRVAKAGTLTLSIPLSGRGRAALHSSRHGHRRLRVKLRLTLVPSSKTHASATSLTVAFR
jgi:hypothetical protein